MPVKTKTRRIRVTKQDIAKAREALLNEPQTARRPSQGQKKKPQWGEDKWYGVVYCDSYGSAWLAGHDGNVCLGKTNEVLKVLKGRRIDGENPVQVFEAIEEFHKDFKNRMYHLDTKKEATGINTHPPKSICITFKKNPSFLRLLDDLISKNLGVLTIQRGLRAKGYHVPYATLGRWIRKRKTKSEEILAS